jgi:hypothetical protein
VRWRLTDCLPNASLFHKAGDKKGFCFRFCSAGDWIHARQGLYHWATFPALKRGFRSTRSSDELKWLNIKSLILLVSCKKYIVALPLNSLWDMILCGF